MPYHVGEKGSYECSGYPVVKDSDSSVMGCHDSPAEAAAQIAAIEANENKTYEEKEIVSNDGGMSVKNPEEWPVEKVAPCWDGYTQRGMKPGENGRMVPNCVPVAKADDYYEDDDDVEYEEVSKAEGYSPPAGARSAARRAIKFKEDGKARGAGTAVGWTRARQLANGETLSLSTVKRMYSYFSRHEVDKKGKDWGNTANPSNGYIMWLAWGGDAGYSWSRRIAQRETDKSMFADFGKDFTRSAGMPDLFKGIGVGSMVSWNSSGGRAEGKITRIIRNGKYNVPGTEVSVTGTEDDPAAVIRLYRDGKPTDITVAHKLKTLRSK